MEPASKFYEVLLLAPLVRTHRLTVRYTTCILQRKIHDVYLTNAPSFLGTAYMYTVFLSLSAHLAFTGLVIMSSELGVGERQDRPHWWHLGAYFPILKQHYSDALCPDNRKYATVWGGLHTCSSTISHAREAQGLP